MDWGVINGIAGIISSICAIISIGYLATHKTKPTSTQSSNILTLDKLISFLLACSGWVLICLSFLWAFEPFGTYPLDTEYKQFYGVLLAFPALIIFQFGYKVMQKQKT